MKYLVSGLALLAMASAWHGGDADARSRYYDLERLLNQPHPFADQVAAPSQPATPAPGMRVRSPARIPPLAPAPRWLSAAEMARLDTPPPSKSNGMEIRLGALIHDEGPFSRNEEDGFDTNLEILFPAPKYLAAIWSPRPHIGATINSNGNTNQGYFGLTWEWDFWKNWFGGFSFGGSIHDGKTKTDKLDRKELGCRLLFREAVEVGYRFNRHHSISVLLDHISNGKICDKNEGLENFGLRYGYRF